MTAPSIQRLASEGLGAALLVATVVGSGIMGEALALGNNAVALLANSIATGAMLFVLITVLQPVSGAHLNPAVTLVFVMRHEIGWGASLAYVLAQVVGAVCGTILAHLMFDLAIVQISERVRTGPSQLLSEAVATFALVLTILGTLRSRPDLLPASVALVIAAAYWFTASTSFANPAVTIARAMTDTFAGIAPRDAPAFIAAQFVGAVAAALAASEVFGWKPAASREHV